ncbi:MAG: hypothetical protein U1F66_03855 [bacterium]
MKLLRKAGKYWFHGLLMGGMLWALLACAGGTTPLGTPGGGEAAPPAPLAELPSLRYPESVSIDTAQLGAGGAASRLSFLSIGDNVSADIQQIQIATAFLQDFADRLVLAPLAPLRIPRGINVTTFEDVIIANDTAANIKIDFARYRYDDAGQGLNCSGNTAALPICYRIWINDIRTVAGIFYAVPEGENPGSGVFKGFPIERVVDGMIGSNYNHQNPLAKETEIFTNQVTELGHGILNEDALAEDVFVTINLAFAEKEERTRNTAKFLRGGQYIGLSQESNSPSLMNYIGACADLMTRLVVDPALCVGEGVDVSAIPFIDFTVPGDTLLPADFPSTPPFQDSPFHSLPE